MSEHCSRPRPATPITCQMELKGAMSPKRSRTSRRCTARKRRNCRPIPSTERWTSRSEPDSRRPHREPLRRKTLLSAAPYRVLLLRLLVLPTPIRATGFAPIRWRRASIDAVGGFSRIPHVTTRHAVNDEAVGVGDSLCHQHTMFPAQRAFDRNCVHGSTAAVTWRAPDIGPRLWKQ